MHYNPFFIAFCVAGAGYVLTLLALRARIASVGQTGMAHFADLRFFTLDVRAEWRVLGFLFFGRHDDKIADRTRLVAAAFFVCMAVAGVGNLFAGDLLAS